MKDSCDMFGRSRERRALEKLLSRAAAGSGGLALVSGEAGIGKSRLIREVVDGGGLAAFPARMHDKQGSAYSLPLELLRQGPPPGTPLLASLLAGGTIDEEQVDALPGIILGALLAFAADKPAVLVLEDLHWADAATLELLPVLASRAERLPLAILASCQNEQLDRNHPMRRIMVQLRRIASVLDLQLKPLTPAATGGLAGEILGGTVGPRLRKELYRRTSGLPFFIEETCRSLAGSPGLLSGRGRFELGPDEEVPLPETIRDSLLLHMDELSEPARQGLEAAAVTGTEADLEVLVQLGIGEDAIDELLQSGIMMEFERGKAGFRHVLMREALLDEIPWSRRRQLNGRLAPLLAGRGASRRVVAEHYKAAGQTKEARESFIEAARESCHLHAYHDAEESFQQALSLWPDGEEETMRLEYLERLAQCAQVCGNLGSSARIWREVVETRPVQADPARHARACRSLASVYSLQSATQQALDARRSALAKFEEAGMDAEAAIEALAIAETDLVLLQLERGLEKAKRALQLAEAAGRPDLEANATSLVGLALAMQGHQVEARRKIEAGLELALRHNSKEAASAAYQRMPYVYGYAADYHGQRDAFGTAIEFCDRESLDTDRTSCLGCMAYTMLRTGEWKRSAEVARDVIKIGEAAGGSEVAGKLVLGMLAVFRGELKRARKLLLEADDAARRGGIGPMELISRAGLAMADELAGETASAARRYRELRLFWEGTEDRLDVLIGICRAATFFCQQQSREELGACAEVARKIADQNAHPEALATLAFTLGEVALADGRPDGAAGHFPRAREQFEKSDLKLEAAVCDWRAGVALRECGDEQGATEHFRRGYREAKKLGARPLLAALSELLAERGEARTEERNPAAPGRIARAGLTQRQQEVAELVAKGLTNKEIASELGLSTRTIDMHVGHVLDRLDCRTRSEAVRKLVKLGVIGQDS